MPERGRALAARLISNHAYVLRNTGPGTENAAFKDARAFEGHVVSAYQAADMVAQQLGAADIDPLVLAGYLLHHLATTQEAENGNKRLAICAASEALAQDGYRIDATSSHVAQFVIEVATGKNSVHQAIDGLAERVAPIHGSPPSYGDHLILMT